MTRLTDEELRQVERDAYVRGASNVSLNEIGRMTAEIRERRSRDLTSDELESMRALISDIREFGILAPGCNDLLDEDERYALDAAWTKRALAVLERLVEGR